MPRTLVILLCLVTVGVASAPQSAAPDASDRPPFVEWLRGVRADALTAGLHAGTVDEALASVERLQVVLERDRAQAEFVLPLDTYLARRVRPQTVRTGREMFGRHRTLLARVADAYGVEPHILVAVWGLESNFGRFSGVRPTLSVLATLGFESRRGPYFRAELLDALRILDRGDIDLAKMRGSWAGAMGQPQFMPSSYLQYAVDFDGDGHRDIWGSPADIFASIANYLREKGWARGERWGREVSLSGPARARLTTGVAARDSGCRATRQLSEPLPLSRWHQLGVRLTSHAPLPSPRDTEASLLDAGSTAFLVYRNYEALLAYNCANSYAVSVGVLADRIAGAAVTRRR